jgi:ribosomal-protein-alanine N-acetyltransferase
MSANRSDVRVFDQIAVDVDALAEIAMIEAQAYAFPWTPRNLRDSLDAGYLFPALRSEGRIIAYSILMGVLEEVHLLNFTVAPDFQGRGWGAQLLGISMQLACSALGARSMLLEVRPSNTVALALYRSRGFRQIGRRRNYYPAPGGREDALVLQRGLP